MLFVVCIFYWFEVVACRLLMGEVLNAPEAILRAEFCIADSEALYVFAAEEYASRPYSNFGLRSII